MYSEALVQDGDMYYHQMKFDDAKAAYQKSLSYTSDYLPARLGIGRLFGKCGQLEEAKQSFKNIVSYDKPNQQKVKDTSFPLH